MATQTKASDNETLEKPGRRRFTAAFKQAILEKTDQAEPGELGAILRKHGLYSSILSDWRRARDEGTVVALTPKKRGPKSSSDPKQEELDRLHREVAKLKRKLEVAELIIGVQKKVSKLLGIELEPEEPEKR
jgi:transposase-like protein